MSADATPNTSNLMSSSRHFSIKVWLLVALLVVVSVLGTLGVFKAAEAVRAEAQEQFLAQYNQQQLLLAKRAADSVQEFFATVRQSLNLITSLFENREPTVVNAAAISGTIRKVKESLEGSPVIELVIFDRSGTVVAIDPPDPYTLGRNYAWRDYYQWARDEGRPGQMYVTRFMKMEGGQYRGSKALIVAQGIYGDDGQFNGVVAFPVNFDALAQRYILPVRIGKEGYAWLVNSSDQTVLVDPAGKVDGKSFKEAFMPQWPSLYNLLMSMGDGQPGTGWYEFQDPGNPEKMVRKVVGYQPIKIEGRLWTLGVATPVGEVEAQLNAFLQRQETFSATLAVAILAGTGLIAGLLLAWNYMLKRQVALRTQALAAARSRLERTFDELLAAKKLAAIGRLALGFAHEIRNPLSAIRMNFQLIRRNTETTPRTNESFDMVDKEIERLNGLLKDVMGFAKPRPLNLQRTDLVALIRQITLLLEQRFQQEQVVLSTQLPDELQVVCDQEQIEQVLLNLVLNAIEAMEECNGDKKMSINAVVDGDTALIHVVDSGGGIAPDDRDKLFDPFFTTKPSGGGLGLANVQSILLHHQGQIWVQSEPGQGTTFSLRLPLNGPDTHT
jgi:two-component system C4-dicarboxylate transport sensor histidine kinase DctB